MAESTRRVEQRASELEDSPEGLRLLFRFLLQLNMDSRSLLPGQHHADSAAVDELAARTMAAFASVMPSSYTPAASERMLSDIGIAIRLSLGIAGHTAPSTAAERERAIELLELALFGAHDGRSS